MKVKTKQTIGYSMVAVIMLPILGGFFYLGGESLANYLGWPIIFGVLTLIGIVVYLVTTLYLIRED